MNAPCATPEHTCPPLVDPHAYLAPPEALAWPAEPPPARPASPELLLPLVNRFVQIVPLDHSQPLGNRNALIARLEASLAALRHHVWLVLQDRIHLHRA